MGCRYDLTGKRFWHLVVRELLPERKCRQKVWLCDCDCGNTTTAITKKLIAGKKNQCSRCYEEAFPDLRGQRFGRLKVRELLMDRISGRRRWLCDCDCGNTVEVQTSELRSRKEPACTACLESRPPKQPAKERISSKYWGHVRHHATRRGLAVEITPEEAYAVFLAQDRKCALTGLPLKLPGSSGPENTASFDRIDSSKGYLKDNIQWVTATINQMKWTFSTERFVGWCQRIDDYHAE